MSITTSVDLTLSSGEADVLSTDAAMFARALADPSARQRYERLAASAASGVVSHDLIAALETMLELLFEKGRPSNPAVLQAIYARTPRGRSLHATARDVNQALETLQGQTIAAIRVSATPARHVVVIETDRCRLTLELDSAGARVTGLETG